MLKLFKKSFLILRNNFIFIQPLLLYLLTVITIVSFVFSRNFMPAAQIVLSVSMLLLFVAFSAGWFYINKCALSDYDERSNSDEYNIKSIQNLKKFFEGVGLNFIKTLFGWLLIITIYLAVLYGMYRVCMHIWGEPKIIYEFTKLTKAQSQAEILNIINSVPDVDKMVFSNWVITLNGTVSVLNLFAILYFAVLYITEKNILVSLWLAIRTFIINIFEMIFILIVTFVLYLFINLIPLFFNGNTVVLVILTILLSIYLNYYLILVFCFYYDKTKNNGNNRTEFIG